MPVELHVPAAGCCPALLIRPWLAADMPWLVAEMNREHPRRGLWSNPDEQRERNGPKDERDAADWLAGQDRGWRNGDWLTFAVLQAQPAGEYAVAGHVSLKNREPGGPVGQRETAEIGYWTAVPARGRGIAPAAVRAVTAWAFERFAATGLRQIMLVHDVDNPASCRVAHKAGYPFRELSPAKPPYWFTDGHIHMRQAG
jgi:RimJ/RimL family protein N-acetyltransferase